MAQEQEDLESRSQTLDHSHSQSSSSDPSLSRNSSFSKLNAKAPEFVPTRPQQPPPPPPPPRLTVVPPPGAVHIYPPPPHSPFHVPIHSPVPVPHVIPVQNHHPRHHNHQHQHHNQQYVAVRNHNSHHQGQSSHYVPVQYHGNQQHQNHYGSGSKKGYSDEDPAAHSRKDAASADHASKGDTNGLSDEAAQKLLNQVEYYFSDLNLATTDHLMRFINKDPEGYVPISVVASFKKIKAAIRSNSQLASILRNSSKLVVSEDGKKVRRQQPFTESDVEELQTRIVLAENLPEDHCHQSLMKIFSTVGSVKTIRTCPPQNSGSGASSASRSAKVDGMHISNKLHAFVEYESVEIAEKAVAELNDEENWSGLKVRLMLRCTSKPSQGRGKKGHDEGEEVSTSEQLQPDEMHKEDSSHHYNNHSHEHSGEDYMNNEREGAQRKGRNRGRGKGRGRGQFHHNHHNNCGDHDTQIIGEQPSMAKQPPGPRMPDGTRGFAIGRGKPLAVNNTLPV